MIRDTRAATMAEYAVIAAIIIAVAVIVFGVLGQKIVNSIQYLTGGNSEHW